MAKRKKRPRLPNGYGSIKYLGKNRRNPYGVYPPVTSFTVDGVPITPAALCYVDDWIKGFAVLTAYKAGRYEPGYEQTLNLSTGQNESLERLTRQILADYNQYKGAAAEAQGKTFSELYKDFYTWKFERDKSREYSERTKEMIKQGFKRSLALHGRDIKTIQYQELQRLLDEDDQRRAGKEHLRSFLSQVFKYAVVAGELERSPAAALQINVPEDDIHGVPFTDGELETLWQHSEDPTIELLLILCFSGWRISELLTLEVNLENRFFCGGIKTDAGKGRIVPIHSAILPLVAHRMALYGVLLPMTTDKYRQNMHKALKALNMTGEPRHTPHDCRHTFSRLCEKYGVRENDRKRMLGHAFQDITNRVYGHRELEDLRAEIQKIHGPGVCC